MKNRTLFRGKLLATLLLAALMASPAVAQTYNSNRHERQRAIEADGWKVAYGREITETDAIRGAVATGVSITTGNPGPALLWAENLVEESLEQMNNSIRREFSGDAKKRASEFAVKTIKGKLDVRISEGSEEEQVGEFRVKAGIAKYTGSYRVWVPNFSREGGYSKKINATFSYQPYVAVRFSTANDPINSPRWRDVDAAVYLSDNRVYFFRGDEYIRYNLNKERADPGYPRKISSAWKGMTFTSGVDAAFATPDKEKIYFFSGGDYIRYDVDKRKADADYPRKISDKWNGVSFDKIDAAFCRQVGENEGFVYFFRGDKYTKYDMETRCGINDGREIKTAWHQRRNPFDRDIDAILPTGDGRIYFFKGGKFFRYVDAEGAYDRGEVTKNNAESFLGVFK